MRKLLITLVAALPLTLGTAAASADGFGPSDGPGGPVVPVVGTVVSTDATSGSFVANAFVPGPGDESGGGGAPGDGGGGAPGDGSGGSAGSGGGAEEGDHFGLPPTTTQVTITTDSNTRMRVNDGSGSVADMSPGDRFVALFSGSPGDSIDTLVANPALAVFDHAAPRAHRHQLYAFVGTVTGTDTVAGTVTVDVTRSLPAGLVPAGSSPVPFTVGPETIVLGGTSSSLFGGSLSDVSVGDIVAGGVEGDAGQTLAQVESSPLKVLLDLPAAAGGGTGVQTSALNRALSLLGVSQPAVTAHKAHKAHRAHNAHKAHRKHRRSHHSRHHKHSPKHARRA